MKIAFAIILLTIAGCQNPKMDLEEKTKVASAEDSIMNSIIGIWGDGTTPGFKITRDSFYDYEKNRSFHAEIEKRDLVVTLHEHVIRLKHIECQNDTLFFEAGIGPVRAYRVNDLGAN